MRCQSTSCAPQSRRSESHVGLTDSSGSRSRSLSRTERWPWTWILCRSSAVSRRRYPYRATHRSVRGVLASASKVQPRLAPTPAVAPKPTADVPERARRGAYRPWAELLERTFGFDVLTCPCCSGRMKLLSLVTEPKSIARHLRGLGEPTDVPNRKRARGPPYWASRLLRRGAGSVEAAE